jgi:DNA processing protein
MPPPSDEEQTLHALLLLIGVPGLGPARIRALAETLGGVEAAWTASRGALTSVPGIGATIAGALMERRAHFDPCEEIHRARSMRVDLLTEVHPAYPRLLREIYDPPPLLYVRGSLAVLERGAVAVVGTRRCSHYGRLQAERLAGALAGAGLTVVSGLARGVDTAAHRAALAAGGATVAVLGSGLDRPYPPENATLMGEIAATGATVTEFPLGTAPHRSNFPRRNRILSGISLGVVVVEASRKSGSLITSRWAMEQGREVFAVPGKIDSLRSSGTHALIKDGAKLVERVEDILEEIAHRLPPPVSGGSRERPDLPAQGGTPGPVLEALGEEPITIEEIIQKTGLDPGTVASSLFRLELAHRVRQFPGKRFSRPGRRR